MSSIQQSEMSINRALFCSVETGRPRRAPMTRHQSTIDSHQLSPRLAFAVNNFYCGSQVPQ